MLESGPLSSPEFAEFGEKVVLFCHVTSRVSTDPYQDLLSEKGGSGFPYMTIMDASGNVLAQYPRERPTVEGFDKLLVKAGELLSLRERAETDDSLQVDLFLAEIDLPMTHTAGRARLAEVKELPSFADKVDEAKMAEIEARLVGLEFMEILMSVPREAAQEEQLEFVGTKTLAMHEAGRIVEDEMAIQFWSILFSYAGQKKDLELMETVASGWKDTLAGDPRASRIIEFIDAELAKVRDAKSGDGEGENK